MAETSLRDPRWEAYVAALEKTGTSLERLSRVVEGLQLAPVHTAADAPAEQASPFVRAEGRGPGWSIRSPIQAAAVEDARRQGLEELAHGANELLLVLDPRLRGAGARWGGGITLTQPDDFAAAIRGVHLNGAGVHLEPGVAWLPAGLALLRAFQASQTPSGDVLGGLGADPLASWVRHGALPAAWRDISKALAELVNEANNTFPRVRTCRVDVAIWPEVGAEVAYELGCGIAQVLEHARALDAAGVSVECALGSFEYRLAAGPDVFETTCKFRAFRRLLERVYHELGAGASVPLVHIEAMPLVSMFTRRDVHTNLVRLMLSATAAALGGAQSIVALGYDHAVGVPDAFSRRLARNVHHLLIEESHLGAVDDPAGGSHYVEARTEQMAEAAWGVMQSIESRGGFVASLHDGELQQKVMEQRDRLRARVARRQHKIVGVSVFPNLDESAEDTRFEESTRIIEGPSWGGFEAASFARAGEAIARSEDLLSSSGGERLDPVQPLRRFRWATDFELLRDRSDWVLSETGARPKLFLACLGPLADHNPRSTWTQNLLAAGGIEAEPDAGHARVDELAEVFRASGAKGAIVCASDATLDELGEDAVAALRTAGAVWVAAAGKKDLGADARVAEGDDILAFLDLAWNATGAPRR